MIKMSNKRDRKSTKSMSSSLNLEIPSLSDPRVPESELNLSGLPSVDKTKRMHDEMDSSGSSNSSSSYRPPTKRLSSVPEGSNSESKTRGGERRLGTIASRSNSVWGQEKSS